MNSKERMLGMLKGNKVDRIPVTPHWWGVYKFQLSGKASGYLDEPKCWALSGKDLAEVDSLFYETFKPDLFHLNCGPGILRDKYRRKKTNELAQRVKLLNSKADIDEYVDLAYLSADEIRHDRIYDHVRQLASIYGNEVFIAVNEGNPICQILDPNGIFGFEEGLIALLEKPNMMAYLIYREYEKMTEKLIVLSEYGCHAYIGSETYCSADIISPKMYRDLIFPAHKNFYQKVKDTGILPIVYFLGDINPLIDDINRMGVAALLVEESKKTFVLDVIDIRKRLSPDITLFGNLDSVYTLLKGTREEVVAETKKQLEAARYGSFVMANGCPVAFDTPKENILAMIETARAFQV